MAYEVRVEGFAGPLDLLFRLIQRAELDITALSLAQVTEQFLSYLEGLDGIELTELNAFVEVACRLLQLKSQTLLPRSESEAILAELANEPSLEDQLKLYAVYRQAADQLQALSQTPAYPHPPRAQTQPVTPRNLTLEAITAAMQQALARDTEPEGEPVKLEVVSLTDRLNWLEAKLRIQIQLDWHSIVPDTATAMELIVTFLAVLELIKRGRITASHEAITDNLTLVATQ